MPRTACMGSRLMHRLAKCVAIVVGVALGLAILFVVFYELHDFRPSVSRINAVYDAMDPEDRWPPPAIQSFVWRVEGEKVDGFAAQRLLGEIRGPQRMLAWHYHSVMWYLFLRAHFGKTERLAFYCHYLPYENGVGFSKASQFYLGKQPDALSLDEIAAIVAIGRSPYGNSPTRHPERLQAAKMRLLDVYMNGR
jgi:hypothetical protein